MEEMMSYKFSKGNRFGENSDPGVYYDSVN